MQTRSFNSSNARNCKETPHLQLGHWERSDVEWHHRLCPESIGCIGLVIAAEHAHGGLDSAAGGPAMLPAPVHAARLLPCLSMLAQAGRRRVDRKQSQPNCALLNRVTNAVWFLAIQCDYKRLKCVASLLQCNRKNGVHATVDV